MEPFIFLCRSKSSGIGKVYAIIQKALLGVLVQEVTKTSSYCLSGFRNNDVDFISNFIFI